MDSIIAKLTARLENLILHVNRTRVSKNYVLKDKVKDFNIQIFKDSRIACIKIDKIIFSDKNNILENEIINIHNEDSIIDFILYEKNKTEYKIAYFDITTSTPLTIEFKKETGEILEFSHISFTLLEK